MSRPLTTVLAEKVDALERKVAALEMEVTELRRRRPVEVAPAPLPLRDYFKKVTPGDPELRWPTLAPRTTCPKCGITLEPVMSYSCPYIDCPTGMGPTIVEVAQGGGR